MPEKQTIAPVSNKTVKRRSPFIQSWFSPAASIHTIFRYHGDNMVHRLMMLRGILTIASLRFPWWVQNSPDPLEVMILLLFVGPVCGLFFTYLYSSVISGLVKASTGNKIVNSDIRIGLAWSYLPVIKGTAIFCLLCAILFPEVFPLPKPPVDYHSVLIGGIIMGAGFLWTCWNRGKMIAEICGIKFKRALPLTVAALLLTDIPLFALLSVYIGIATRIIDF